MNAVMKHEDVELLDAMPSQALAPTDNPYMAMAQQALSLGKVEQLDKLLDMQFKWDNEQARKAYLAAFAAFKESPLLVTKDKKNLQYNSTYTSIGNMVNTVSEAMAPHGLSADWEVDQSDPKNITVTCILSHERGHSKRVSMSGPPDTSGAKNDLQKIKSTVTYLKIATFEAVTGTASQEGNLDDDGNAAGKGILPEEQAWLDVAASLDDASTYKTKKAELVTHYKGAANIPPRVRAAFNAANERTKPKD